MASSRAIVPGARSTRAPAEPARRARPDARTGSLRSADLRPRLYVVAALLLGFALVIAARLAMIQVVQSAHFAQLATAEHWRETPLPARRGDILDASGYPLATTVAFESVYASTTEIDKPAAVATQLAPVLGVPEASLLQTLSKRQSAPVLLAAGLTDDIAKRVEALNQPGIFLQIEPRRVYPQGNLAAQLLGVVGVDGSGLSGLELELNAPLAGKPGQVLADRDTSGDAIPYGPHQITPPIDGSNVTLTIDRYVQWVAERELNTVVENDGLRGGSVVVVDPRDGAVLAVAGRPSFDHGPDLYSPRSVALYGIPAISEVGEPGPAFKAFALAAALDAHAVEANTVFANTGSFSYAGQTVRDLAPEPPGNETYAQALERSSTLAVAWAATRTGAPAFYGVVDRLGFGTATGIDLPGEASGSLRSPTSPDWFAMDLATNASGRGFQTTPIQLAVAAAALANGGTHYSPYVVKSVAGQSASPRQAERPVAVLSASAANALTNVLVAGVDDPASPLHGAALPGYAIAGTAGTIEAPVPDAYNQTQQVATFIGYAPADRPRFVVVVQLDGVRDGSTETAVGVFSAMNRQLLSYYQIPPGRPTR